MDDSKDRYGELVHSWWRVQEASLDLWANTLAGTGSDAYARVVGAAIAAYLPVSAGLAGALEQALRKSVQQMDAPRHASLADRLANIETRLDALSAKLDLLQRDPVAGG